MTREAVYVGESAIEGLRKWLQMVAKHKVPAVLIDTADKAQGWRILTDQSTEKGLLTATQIRSIDRFAGRLGVKVLWAGGISLEQCYEFGRMGVFGIYVTSAAASPVPVPRVYERDPLLAALKEPTFEGVYRAKLLLEAGFLSEQLARAVLGRKLARAAKALMDATRARSKNVQLLERELAGLARAGWKAHLKKNTRG